MSQQSKHVRWQDTPHDRRGQWAIDLALLRAIELAAWVCWLLPWQVWHVLATAVGVAGMCTRLRPTVLANIRHVWHSNPPPRILAWYVGMQQIATHIKTIVSVLRLSVNPDVGHDSLVMENPEYLSPYLGKRGIVIVAPHAGPYPSFGMMAVPWLRSIGYHGALAVVVRLARPFGSDAIMRWMTEHFRRAGTTVIPLAESSSKVAQQVLRILRGNGVMVLFVDEPLPTACRPVRFFDSTIEMPTGPAALARATGSVIVPCIATFGKAHVSRLTLAPPIEPGEPDETMRSIASSLERLISRHLDQWSMLTPIWEHLEASSEPAAREGSSGWRRLARSAVRSSALRTVVLVLIGSRLWRTSKS